ncbi:hypothetical protein [Pseudomarimonas arenosa]|uniref:Uncharacterized protein n=1 Tax=Pseudomarimonas arenosa TaxID=2774145 RepID=A0AAW3ZHR5_9GAMM|nr:hypothetical protein [Pseudomarimonas arenosa]MBD8524667.1 hypothetical protein [Pseudomarimonas arenosa]
MPTFLRTGLWALVLCCSCAQATAPVRLPASELADPSLLSGPGFSVRPEAEIAGLQARFVIDTRWGELQVDSVELLAVRVEEMAAVSVLYGEKVSNTLKRAGLEKAGSPWNSAVAISASPLERAERLPAGVLSMFSTKLRRWGERFRRWGDRVDRAIFQSGDASQGFDLVEHADKPKTPWWDAPADEMGRLLRSASGHGAARRQVATALGIASDTSNPLLRSRLDALAWAVAGQKIALDSLADLLLPGLRQTVGYVEQADTLTRAPSEESLRARNEQRLQALSADQDLTYWLAWRGGFSANLMAQLLDELDRLGSVRGKVSALEAAAIADNELEARFVINSVRMLQSVQLGQPQGGELRAVGHLLAYLAADGELHLCLPVDYLQWTRPIAQWFDHPQIAESARRSVLVAGQISPRAARQISRRGWSLLPGLRYPASPPYPQLSLRTESGPGLSSATPADRAGS